MTYPIANYLSIMEIKEPLQNGKTHHPFSANSMRTIAMYSNFLSIKYQYNMDLDLNISQ